MNRTNYIFVDYENIREVDLDLIADKPVEVILVLGQRHKELPVELVKKLIKYPKQVRMVETGHTGKNALDHVLAYHIGLQAAADPKGFFHILSKDKGFDALIRHLKDNGMRADRHAEFGKIGIFQTNPPALAEPTLAERSTQLTAHFAKHRANQPKREKTLRSHVHAHFGKKLTDAELDTTIQELLRRKVIEISPTGAVSYP